MGQQAFRGTVVMSEPNDDLSEQLRSLKAGDEEAVRQVWQEYAGRLQRLADRRLGGMARRASDEEDVVLSAFNSFCSRAAGGQFPKLENADDLWRLLATITARKAAAHRKREQAIKRGGGAIHGESWLDHRPDTDHPVRGLDQVPDSQPTPQRLVELAERFDYLLDRLSDPSLRETALLKLAAHTNEEIAQILEVSVATVERRLRAIRLVWAEEREEGP